MNAASPAAPQVAASAARGFHSGMGGASTGSSSGQANSRHFQNVGAVAQVSRDTSVAAPTRRSTKPRRTVAPAPAVARPSRRLGMAAIASVSRACTSARSIAPRVATASLRPAGSTRTAVTPGWAWRKFTRSSIHAADVVSTAIVGDTLS